MTVLRVEELLRESEGVRPESVKCGRGWRVANFLDELLNDAVGLCELVSQLLIRLLKSLDLLALPLPGRLCCPSIPQDTLDPALLLLVFSLGTFPGGGLVTALDPG